jgi:hypothetical protein
MERAIFSSMVVETVEFKTTAYFFFSLWSESKIWEARRTPI